MATLSAAGTTLRSGNKRMATLCAAARLSSSRNSSGVAEALRQVNGARFFVGSQEPQPPREGITVIDLSLRSLLASSVVGKISERLTQDLFYKEFNLADPALANREALKTERVAERLTALLSLVGNRLGHVTMRQLVGCLAFLITGGCSQTGTRCKAGQDAAGFFLFLA